MHTILQGPYKQIHLSICGKVRVEVGSPAPSLQVISPMSVISESSDPVDDPTCMAESSSTVLKLGEQR